MPLGVKISGLKTKAVRSAVPPAVWANVYKSTELLYYYYYYGITRCVILLLLRYYTMCITIITTVLHDVYYYYYYGITRCVILLLLPYYTMCNTIITTVLHDVFQPRIQMTDNTSKQWPWRSKFDQKLHSPPNDRRGIVKSADDDISSSSPSDVQHLRQKINSPSQKL